MMVFMIYDLIEGFEKFEQLDFIEFRDTFKAVSLNQGV